MRTRIPGRSKAIEAELVDVSARGVRIRWGGEMILGDGPITIEILLDDGENPGAVAKVVLDGRGRVVWERDLGIDGRHAGIHFDAPVDVRPSFPEVVVF